MPKFDVGVEAPGLARARVMTMTDTDAARATAALKAFYGGDLTDAEAWDRFFEQVRRQLVEITRKTETDAARTAAEANVSALSVS